MHFYIDKWKVARSIKKLEDQKILFRQIDPKSLRRYLLYLTEKGRDTVPHVHKIDSEWEEFVLSDYREGESTKIAELLRNLAKKSLNRLEDNNKLNNESI